MKTALLISGLPRFVKESYGYIKRAIIDNSHLNIDIFIHAWIQDEQEWFWFEKEKHHKTNIEVASTILDLYQPNKYLFEPQKPFINKFIDTRKSIEQFYQGQKAVDINGTFPNRLIEATYSQWYSYSEANRLKELYRLENNISYDCVIRCRFDTLPHRHIPTETLDLTKIWCEEDGRPKELVNDWFFVGNNEIMNVLAGTFLHFDAFYKRSGLFSSEHIVSGWLKQNNIEVAKRQFMIGLHPR